MKMRRRIFIVGLLLSLVPLKSIQSKISSSSTSKGSISKSALKTTQDTPHDQYIVVVLEVFVASRSENFMHVPLPGGGILNYLKMDLNIARGPPKELYKA